MGLWNYWLDRQCHKLFPDLSSMQGKIGKLETEVGRLEAVEEVLTDLLFDCEDENKKLKAEIIRLKGL